MQMAQAQLGESWFTPTGLGQLLAAGRRVLAPAQAL